MSEYEDDVKIDKEALDIEFATHADKYIKWAERAARASEWARNCKKAIEVVDAMIGKEMRSTGEKITETQIKSDIALDPRHQKALEDLNKALYEDDMMTFIVRAMGEFKKSDLENLVRLWAGSYFAGPKTPLDIMRNNKDKEKIKEVRDHARAETSQKVN
jgi:hypothetical protein